jgi:hypothetical protein
VNRVVTTAAAAAAASALLSAFAARDARAQLVFDSFNYTAASPLENKINPINGQPWSTMSANAADDDIVSTAGSVSYSGLAASSGNSVSFGGVGKSERLGLDKTVKGGSLYYSLVLRVSGVGRDDDHADVHRGVQRSRGRILATADHRRHAAIHAAGAQLRAGRGNVPTRRVEELDIRHHVRHEGVFSQLAAPGRRQLRHRRQRERDGRHRQAVREPDVARVGERRRRIRRSDSPIITAPVAGTDLTISGVPSLGGFVLRQGSSAATTVPNVQIDELRIDNAWARVTPPTGVTWNVDNGGAWSEAAKWSTAASPNSSEAFVNFNGNITGPKTVTVDSAGGACGRLRLRRTSRTRSGRVAAARG